MSDNYIGEIRMFGGNFEPVGWAFCNGQLLAISQYEALFALIGTTYGGDGESTFALPDLQGRSPVDTGPNFVIGQRVGVESVTVTTNQLPVHTHGAVGTSDPGTATDPTNGVWASTTQLPYAPGSSTPTAMVGDDVGITGGTQPHNNLPPFLCVSFIIALEGIFPSQN